MTIIIIIITLGPINNKGLDFTSDLGRHLTQATGEPRESSYLLQRISITLQRFNAVAFRGSFISPMPDTDEKPSTANLSAKSRSKTTVNAAPDKKIGRASCRKES